MSAYGAQMSLHFAMCPIDFSHLLVHCEAAADAEQEEWDETGGGTAPSNCKMKLIICAIWYFATRKPLFISWLAPLYFFCQLNLVVVAVAATVYETTDACPPDATLRWVRQQKGWIERINCCHSVTYDPPRCCRINFPLALASSTLSLTTHRMPLLLLTIADGMEQKIHRSRGWWCSLIFSIFGDERSLKE